MVWMPGSPVELLTENFVIRSMREQDITQRYADWWRDPELMAGLSTPYAGHSVERHRQQLRNQYDNKTKFLIGLFDKSTGKLIGVFFVFTNSFHRVANMTTIIGERDYWGKNILLELNGAGMDFLFGILGVDKVGGKAMARNLPTVFINKAMGLKVEAVLRKEWRMPDGTRADLLQFGILREEWEKRRKERSI
ncbi:MAG: GNAT family N-acetyltransferase [Proteobacteria bacterium]|nr:GNAT family N-acetyltransferase [Pseudomonadota bacterium]